MQAGKYGLQTASKSLKTRLHVRAWIRGNPACTGLESAQLRPRGPGDSHNSPESDLLVHHRARDSRTMRPQAWLLAGPSIFLSRGFAVYVVDQVALGANESFTAPHVLKNPPGKKFNKQ
jgi:hypothetical protein